MASLLRIGAVQFGRFERSGTAGQFDPLNLNLKLLPSFPATLTTMSVELAPLTQVEGATHLLAMPATISLATLISIRLGVPLVYPLEGQIEGAYDFNEPTVLLTDVLRDGTAEIALIRRAKREGLDIQAVVSVFDFEREIDGLPRERRCWFTVAQVLAESARTGKLTPSMKLAAERWLHA